MPRFSARPPIARLVIPAALAAAVLLAVAGCQSGPQPTSESEPTADPSADAPPPPPRPGAAGWSGHALSLPADSPIVTVVRPDALLRNARQLRDWLLAEPAMYGENGQRIVTRQEMLWGMVEARMGADPLSEEGPRKFGLDVTRRVLLGMYPASAGRGAEFVEAVEATLREHIELEDDGTLLGALRAMRSGTRQIPEGLNARVLQAVESLDPHMGFRLVVPLQHPREFLKRIGRLASALEYKRIGPGGSEADPEEPEQIESEELPVERIYYDVESDWPAFMVRIDDTEAKVDILFREFRPRGRAMDASEAQQRERLETSLRSLISTFGAGRPAAPRPDDAPLFAVAADQQASAQYARLEGYKKVMERLRNSAVGERDRQMVVGLSRAMTIADTWSQGSERLTGVSYSLAGKSADAEGRRLFRLGMTMFGKATGARPVTHTAGAGLNVADRGLGLSLALAPLAHASWQEWVGLDDPRDLLGHSDAADSLPLLYILSFPRNLALFLANTKATMEKRAAEVGEAFEELSNTVQRVEVATSGTTPEALRLNPQLVALLAIDPAADAARRQSLLDRLADLLAYLASPAETPNSKGADAETSDAEPSQPDSEQNQSDAPTTEGPAAPELSTGTLQKVPFGGDELPDNLHYYAQLEGSTPYILLTVGLDATQARAEIDRVRPEPTRPNDLFFLRLEPATFLSAMTAFDQTAFEPLDLGILTQRIGPLVTTVRPDFDADVRRIRYRLELRRPPEL